MPAVDIEEVAMGTRVADVVVDKSQEEGQMAEGVEVEESYTAVCQPSGG